MPRTARTPKKGTSTSVRPAWPDRFLKELRERGTIGAAAKAIHVGRSTVYDELARNPEFATDVENVRRECVEEVESTLYQRALQPDGTTDRIFYLKNLDKARFGDGMNPEQIAAMRVELRSQVITELELQIAQLPPAPRKIVLAALNRVAQQQDQPQLTP